MNFADSLKKILNEMGVSQNELGRRTGKDSSSISKIMTGGGNVTWNTIQEFAEALGISPGVFFATEDEMLSFIVNDLPEDTKDFIRNRQNQTWIFLAKDLKNSGYSVQAITRAVELLRELDNK